MSELNAAEKQATLDYYKRRLYFARHERRLCEDRLRQADAELSLVRAQLVELGVDVEAAIKEGEVEDG